MNDTALSLFESFCDHWQVFCYRSVVVLCISASQTLLQIMVTFSTWTTEPQPRRCTDFPFTLAGFLLCLHKATSIFSHFNHNLTCHLTSVERERFYLCWVTTPLESLDSSQTVFSAEVVLLNFIFFNNLFVYRSGRCYLLKHAKISSVILSFQPLL